MSPLTREQIDVINAPVGDILVSAAAGSGKTKVMTDRIVQRIVERQTDIRSVLVMTFTDKAARQMRDKIAEKLRDALTAAEDEATVTYLRRQLLLLPGALISTIHAFCLTVIRNFYYEARDAQGEPLVLPDFTTDDGTESSILLQECLDDLLRECYEAIDRELDGETPPPLPDDLAASLPEYLRNENFTAAFYRLADGYGGARGDEPLKALIGSLFKSLRSMPDYTQVIADKIAVYEQSVVDFAGSRAATLLLRQLKYRLDRAMTVIPELEDMLTQVAFYKDRKRSDQVAAQFQAAFSCLRRLHAGIGDGSMGYDDVYAASRPLADLAIPRGNKTDSETKKAFVALFVEYVAESVYTAAGGCGQEKCQKAFQFDPLIVCERPAAAVSAELGEMLPAVRVFFGLILALDARYAAAKRQAGIIEFSDFEHLALTILRGAEAGAYYRSRVAEIYIDEYQDTSQIQEAIIAAIRNGNCLMVGDVKQSIYRFRHARPQIFLDKLQLFRAGEGGSLIELNRNFRSQSVIIDTVNQWFSQLMSLAVGEIRYNDGHALAAGATPEPALPAPAVTLLFLDLKPDVASPAAGDASAGNPADEGSGNGAGPETGDGCSESSGSESSGEGNGESSDESSEESGSDTGDDDWAESVADLSRYEKEARMVAVEISRLMAQGVSCGEIAVLARTTQILGACSDTLTANGIPVEESVEQPFLDTPVLRFLEALVHVLDNRSQDIPLTAIMRSPLYAGGFSDEELARIRLASKRSGRKHVFFHEAVDWYATEGGDPRLRARTAGFLAFVDDLRQREPAISILELLVMVLEKTGIRDQLARLPEGRQAVADINLFLDFANRFEQRARRGIYAFARHIERLHELGRQKPVLGEEQAMRTAVRLLTMHGSKGLEFPVVFIVGTTSHMNLREKDQSLLLSEEVGIGIDYVDPERRVRYPTPLKQAMFEELKARSRSEELRLLYVAMTRAQKALYLTGSFEIGSDGDTRAMRLIEAARAVDGLALPEHLVLAARSYQDWVLLALARNPAVDLSPLFGRPVAITDTAFAEIAATTANDNATAAVTAIDENNAATTANNITAGVRAAALATLEPVAGLCVRYFALNRLPQPGPDGLAPAAATAAEMPAAAEASAAAAQASLTESTGCLPFNSARLLYDPLPAGCREPAVASIDEKSAIDAHIRANILGSYAWPGTVRLPQKISVSELKRRSDQLADMELATDGSTIVQGITQTISDWTEPEPTVRKATAAEIGTAVHQAMRFLDLEPLVKEPTQPELARQLDDLVTHAVISAELRAAFHPYLEPMRRFFASSLAQRMLAAEQAGLLYREMPFSIAIPASEINPDVTGVAADDRMLIQGMIDVWFRENGKAVLIDFKTDRLRESPGLRAETLRSRYRVQIDCYARAITLATGLPVEERLVYALQDGRLVSFAEVADEAAWGIDGFPGVVNNDGIIGIVES